MKNKKAAIIALALAASMAFGACGAKNTLDPTEVVATVGEHQVTLGVANFAATVMQAQYESYYKSFLGNDMWNQVIGETRFEDQVKSGVMDSLKNYYLAADHADEYGVSLSDEDVKKISDTAERFIKDNDKKALNQMTAAKDTIEEFLSVMTVQNRVYKEVIKGADTDIPDEDAIQKRVNYVFVSTVDHEDENGETVSYTDEEKAELKAKAQKIADAVKDGKDFEEAVTEEGETMSTGTFGKDYEGGVNAVIRNASEGMKAGDVTDVLEIDGGYYVAQLVSENDEEATASRRQSLVSLAQQDFYEKTAAKWEEEEPFTINEDVWSKVTFTVPLSIKAEEK